MKFKKAMDFLNSLPGLRDEWKLEDMQELMDKLGNPEKELKVIHVTGTNGKGSVAAMISSILTDAGYKIGTYTSPHLKRFSERIKINNEEINERDIVKYVDKIKPFVNGHSYFEVATAMAFIYFRDSKVDFAVMEVGMGGRLDATNVCNSIISVITNIGIEHRQHLGETVRDIAKEKAGIIKPDTYCVTAADGEALETIKEVCKNKNTELFTATPTGLKLNLKGDFQKLNAGIAIKAIKRLKHYSINIPKKNIIDGLLKVKWPGRFEFLENNLLIDCAHNPDGINVLVKEVKKLKYNRLILVIGVSSDKDYKLMLDEIIPMADKVIITKYHDERALDPKKIAKYCYKESEIIDNVNDAIKKAKSIADKQDLILVAGSIYLIGEIENCRF